MNGEEQRFISTLKDIVRHNYCFINSISLRMQWEDILKITYDINKYILSINDYDDNIINIIDSYNNELKEIIKKYPSTLEPIIIIHNLLKSTCQIIEFEKP
jgi:hypothetical protein